VRDEGRAARREPQADSLIADIDKLNPDEERALADESLSPRDETVGLLLWLQDWYQRHCDSDWEHQYGIRIDTLDNPGWMVKIDLAGTALEGRTAEWVKDEVSETDWIHYRVRDDVFEAAGGPANLVSILRAFRTWVGRNAL
jgi:hypothetical protein